MATPNTGTMRYHKTLLTAGTMREVTGTRDNEDEEDEEDGDGDGDGGSGSVIGKIPRSLAVWV